MRPRVLLLLYRTAHRERAPGIRWGRRGRTVVHGDDENEDATCHPVPHVLPESDGDRPHAHAIECLIGLH